MPTKFFILILLTLNLISCSGELIDTEGIEQAAITASKNLKDALTEDSYVDSALIRQNINFQNPQKLLEARVNSLHKIKVTFVRTNQFQGRGYQNPCCNQVLWEDLGLVLIYEGRELLPDPSSFNQIPQRTGNSSVEMIFTVDGNLEDTLQIFVDLRGRQNQMPLIGDLKIQIQSKTNLNNKGDF